MAEGKNSFLLYSDYINIFEKLSDEEAGLLAKHMFRYVNDKNPVTDNRLIEIVFEPIKQQLKRDLKEWRSKIESKSTNGKLGNLKRWNEDLYDQVINEEITIEKAEEIAQSRKSSHSDSSRQNSSQTVANIAVTVTDTVTDNVTEEDIPPLPPKGNESEPKTWKKDFQVYLKQLREAFSLIKRDKEWISQQESFNPGIDVIKSIEKSCVNYWATEAGWKKKVRSRSTSIDWKGTFGNAIALKSNKVYYDHEKSFVSKKKEPEKPDKW